MQKKDGSFDIPEVLPGSYILTALWFDEGKTYSTRVPVEVGSADANLEGSDLTVNLKPTNLGWNFWGSGARVGQGNVFTLKDVGEGAYIAEMNGQSKDCYVKRVEYGGSDASEDGFTVTRGTPASLEITISSRGARVHGNVADADSLPAAGVWVVLVPETAHRAQSRRYKTQTTDQYGHFDLRGIAPGEYTLCSWEDAESGPWEDPEFLKPFEEKGKRIFFQEGDQKSVNLTAIRAKSTESGSVKP